MNAMGWIGLIALLARPLLRGGEDVRKPAWQAWASGNVRGADELAADLPGEEATHLRFLVATVTGRYEEAVALHATLPPSYRRYAELDEPLIEVYRHLGRYDQASSFARTRKLDPTTIDVLDRLARQPLKLTLEGAAVVPFADHPLTPYLPAFQAEINGTTLVVHVDTGAAHLTMNPERARQLGIELTTVVGDAFHGTQKTELRGGLARSFRLGAAAVENVPVQTLATLTGPQDFVIFGTSVLERLLATLDYPQRRLILTPRGDPHTAEEHWRMLPSRRTEIPFFLWGDHYLFARGGIGARRDLNFFIDSGLVAFMDDDRGRKQVAFMARGDDLQSWGVPKSAVRRRVFESSLTVSLGGLTRGGTAFLVEDNPPWRSFGGLRIDGLLSHAFLSAYAWTIDFDRRVFVFSD